MPKTKCVLHELGQGWIPGCAWKGQASARWQHHPRAPRPLMAVPRQPATPRSQRSTTVKVHVCCTFCIVATSLPHSSRQGLSRRRSPGVEHAIFPGNAQWHVNTSVPKEDIVIHSVEQGKQRAKPSSPGQERGPCL